MDPEHILRQIQPDRGNLRHDRLPIWTVAIPPWHVDAVGGVVAATRPVVPGMVDAYLTSTEFKAKIPRTQGDYRKWALRFAAEFRRSGGDL